VKEESEYSLYFDNVLMSSYEIKGTPINLEGDMFIGGDPWHWGVVGA